MWLQLEDMDKSIIAKFKATPFYSLYLERNKKLEQFKELIQLEYDWLSEVVKEIPAMLPQDEFMVLPAKTPAKRKLAPKPVEVPKFDLADEEEVPEPSNPRASRRVKAPKSRQLRSAAKPTPGEESDAITDDPLTLSQLDTKAAAGGGRPLRSRVVKNSAADISTASSTRGGKRQSGGGGGGKRPAAKKLSSHSRACAYSPRHIKYASPSAASTPEASDAGKQQRKQRTLRLKRTATANVKRLFVSPEKKRQMEEEATTNTNYNTPKRRESAKEEEEEDRFVTAVESSVQMQKCSTPVQELPRTRACQVVLSPIGSELIARLLNPEQEEKKKVEEEKEEEEEEEKEEEEEEEKEEEEEEKENAMPANDTVVVSSPKTADPDKTVPIERSMEKEIPATPDVCKSVERKSQVQVAIDSGAEADLEDMVSATPFQKPKRSTLPPQQPSRVSRKRSSRQAMLAEAPVPDKKVLVGEKEKDSEETAASSAAPAEVALQEEQEVVDVVAPLGPSTVVAQQYSNEAEQDSLLTDDDWSTMDDTDNLSTMSQDGSSVSTQHKQSNSGRFHLLFGGPNRTRLAHSADGGRRFGKFKKWTAHLRTSSQQNTSADQKNLSRCSNTSTPGRLQKRPSASGRLNEMEEEKRRELNERMRKDAQRLKEREERLLREREARKRANEERRKLVLSKREASCKEKLNSLRQQWEEKERHALEVVRERKEEEQRRRLALASLRRQAEEREREERERREAERRAREETERKAREEAERRARQEAERRARVEAERRAREEAYKKAKEEERRLAKLEEERKRQEAREAARLAQKQQEHEANVLKASSRMNVPFVPPSMTMPMASKKRPSSEHYDISDLHSDQETDDDEQPRKKVPTWANRNAMVRLCRRFWQQETKWWKVFRPADTIVVDLNQIFSGSTRGFRNRTSSAVWDIPPALKSSRPYL